MSDVPASVTMQNLIDRLWNFIVGDPGAGQTNQSVDPSTTAVFLCHPGIPIRGEDFAGMRSEFNPQGNIGPTAAFSSWVDRIPDVTLLRYAPTNATVSGGYGMVVAGACSGAGEASPQERETYDKARSYLYARQKNPFTGTEDDSEVETPLYQTYKIKRRAYNDALFEFVSKWSDLDLNRVEDQKVWQREGLRLQRAIDSAWDDWNAANRRYVEMALDLLGSKLKNMVAHAITEANRRYEQAPVPSGTGLFYPAYPFPHRWWEESAQGWTQMRIKSDYGYLHTEQHTKSFSAKASFLGLFTFGGKGGYSSDVRTETRESTDVEIAMKVAVVDVLRPWLRTDWMKCSNWYLKDERAGSVSHGDARSLSNTLLLPLVPTRVIAARDIQLTGNWSKETREEITRNLSSGASFGFGPFSLGGTYEQGDASKTMTSRFEGNTLKVDGMQWLGVVASCPPRAAPLDDPDLRK